MRPTTLKSTLTAAIAINRPLMIEGAPGLGKTEITKQVARDLGWNGKDNRPDQEFGYLHLHAPLMQPEDYAMPVVNADRTSVDFIVASKFPMLGNDSTPERGLINIDELPQADNSGQKILANLIQERELHGQKLKPGWAITATGNRAKDRAGANRILSHLRARMTTIEFEPQVDDWVQWCMQNDVSPMVPAFIRWKPALLLDEDSQAEIKPNPRSWVEGVASVIGKVPAEAEFECFKGAVGEGPAGEFVAFLQLYRELPDPDLVIKNPDTHPIPTGKPSVMFALTGALASRATPDNFDALLRFYQRPEMPAEFMVLLVRDAVARCPEVQDTDAFVQWSIGPGAKVLLSA